MASLKSKNTKYLAGVLAADTALFFAVAFGANYGTSPAGLSTFGTTSALSLLATLVLSWIIPSDVKEMLVFWRVRHVLPGHRAFSKLMLTDERIDFDRLRASVGEFPLDPATQNKLWYRLLKRHNADEGIQETHQRFLCFRDAAGISIVLCVATPILATFLGATAFWVATIAFLVQYLVFVAVARNAANRLVVNVLALEAASESKS